MPRIVMPGSSRPRGLRPAILACIALVTLALGAIAPAAAQNATPEAPPEAEVVQLKVGALLCLDWSCFEFGDRIDGFTIYAVDNNSGDTLDSCVTDTSSEFEGCWLEVPADAQWSLTFDEAQTPAGYVYHGSPIAVSGGAHGEITYIPFHPLTDPEPGHIVVQAALCTDASCDEYAELLDNFLISAVNPDTGQEYSECMTDNAQQALDHQCILDVPAKGEVELQWNEDQVPDGYAPFGEPITAGEPRVTTLAFVPEGEEPAPTATQAPVTTLPVTGSQGPDADAAQPTALVVLATVLLGMLAVTIYQDVRRR